MSAPKECFQAAFHASPPALIVRLPKSRASLVDANAAACRLLNITEVAKGTRLTSAVPALATPELLTFFQDVYKRHVSEVEGSVDVALGGHAVSVSAVWLSTTLILVHLTPNEPVGGAPAAEEVVLGKRKRSEVQEEATAERIAPSTVKTSVAKAQELFDRLVW